MAQMAIKHQNPFKITMIEHQEDMLMTTCLCMPYED
jgi:hypothetical protein